MGYPGFARPERAIERSGASAAGPREVAAAWLFCLIVAVSALVAAAAREPSPRNRPEALISPVPAATVRLVEADHRKAHHERRC